MYLYKYFTYFNTFIDVNYRLLENIIRETYRNDGCILCSFKRDVVVNNIHQSIKIPLLSNIFYAIDIELSLKNKHKFNAFII